MLEKANNNDRNDMAGDEVIRTLFPVVGFGRDLVRTWPKQPDGLLLLKP